MKTDCTARHWLETFKENFEILRVETQLVVSQKIIEFIGPPGIGKTSIYESLCKTWRSTSNWTYQEALLTPKPHFSEFNKRVEYRLRRLLGKKIIKSIPVEYGLRFVENHQELADFCWNYLSDTQAGAAQEISKRFRAAHFLFTDFCRYQAVMESNAAQPCIIKEGLLQKSFFIHDDEQVMLAAIDKYIPLLPLPYAIIYINTPDKNIIVERLRSRKKVIASHLGKGYKDLLADIEKWQYLLDLIVEKMKCKNVPIYHIEGSKPVEENVISINKLLK